MAKRLLAKEEAAVADHILVKAGRPNPRPKKSARSNLPNAIRWR
jgi:hypothetical protein